MGRLGPTSLLLLLTTIVPLQAHDGAVLRQYSVRSGLSQSSVYAVVQDRRGFLWLGTEDGLNRFDGYDFEIFRPDPLDPGSLSDNHVRALLEDRSGELWIGTMSGRIDRFDHDREVFESFRTGREASGAPISAIIEDYAGELWIATYGDGLYRVDAARGSLVRYAHGETDPNRMDRDRVLTVFEDFYDTLWIGTEGGLERFDRESESFAEGPRGSPPELALGVHAIYEDPERTLWIGTEGGGLYGFHGAAGTWSRHRCPPEDAGRPGHRVTTIFEDHDTELWVATSHGGLKVLDRETGRCKPFHVGAGAKGGFEGGHVLTAYPDREGNLWLGTLEGGAWYFRRSHKPFCHERPDTDGPQSAYVYSIFEDRGGTLWLGTEGGLYRRDRASSEFRRYQADPDDPTTLCDNTVWAIYEDHLGVLWIGTRMGGLDRFDRERETFSHFHGDPDNPRSLTTSMVRHLYEDRSGTLWVTTVEGGLHRYHRDTEDFERFAVDSEDPNRNTVTCLLERRTGLFWAGTLRGLAFFDPGRGAFVEPPAEALRRLDSTRIRDIYEDREGRLWIATQGEGLFVFDPRSRRLDGYRVRDGLPNDVVYAVLEDGKGHLWLSTNLGLSRFDPRTETFRNYDADDGLQSNEFNAGAFHRSPDGTLYFGGVNGVTSFHPDEVFDDPYPPPVAVTDVRLLDESVGPVDEIRLTHRDRAISFEFVGLSFANPEKNSYAYILENFDDDWVASGTRRFATYTNLPPGSYVFRVRAASRDGVWNEAGASVKVHVAPAPWKTWWALSLYALALLSGAAAFVRSQQKKLAQRAAQVVERERLIGERDELIAELEARNQELAQFNYTVSHDLRNPLVTIKNFLGLAIQDADLGDRHRLEHDLASVGQAADQIESRLRDLVEFSHCGHRVKLVETFPAGEVVRRAVDNLAESIARHGVEVEVAPDLPRIEGDRRRLLVVFESLVDNAVKFMGRQKNPRVEVSARTDGATATFFVSDNGIGIEERYQEKIFGLFDRLSSDSSDPGTGLALVRRIVEAHGGRVWVESEGRGRGSTFCLTLPTRLSSTLAPPRSSGSGKP